MNRFILLGISILLGTAGFSQYEDEKSFGVEPPRPDEVVENYNENGTYEKYVNGKLVASGFHVNQQLNGELTKYYRSVVTEITEYKLGKKHGKSVVKHNDSDYSYNYSRYDRYDEISFYENDALVGYQYHIAGNDTIYKLGPFGEKVKKENRLVYWSKSEFGGEDSHGLDLISEISYLFKNNLVTEKAQKTFIGKGDEVKQIYHHVEYFNPEKSPIRYSEIKGIDFLYGSPGEPLYSKMFAENGDMVSTHYNDSVTSYFKLTGHANTNYYNLGQKPGVRFRSVNDKGIKVCEAVLNENETFELSFYTEKKGDLLYKVTSKNNVYLTIQFAADSLKPYYQRGEFRGVDGVKYFFDSNGKISKSKTKEEQLYEWKAPFTGSYVSITDRGNSFKEYTQFDFTDTSATVTKKRVQYMNESVSERVISQNKGEVFQKDSVLYVVYSEKSTSESLYNPDQWFFTRLVIRNNTLYQVYPGLSPLSNYYRANIFPIIERDACDPIALPLIPLTDFKPTQEYKKLETASKSELEQFFKELEVYYKRFLALEKSVKYNFAQDYFEYNSDAFKREFFRSKGYELQVSRSSFELYLTNLGFTQEEVKRNMDLIIFKGLKAI